ncbi:MAG: shikimate dehydrogenase [Candidatus Gastranaerophilales bacterium]|nr:shikimate dehydrogenase [Candidatus Gastranaerophilales bacterium]
MKYKLGIIGYPLGHSISAVIQKAGFKSIGLDADYDVMETPAEDLVNRIKYLKANGYHGFNVTIPLKIPISFFMSDMDDYSNIAGCINTVKINGEQRELFGYNTDIYGFKTAIPETINLKGKNACILGTGGASRAAAVGLIERGVTSIDFYTRNIINAQNAINYLRDKFPNIKFTAHQIQNIQSLPETAIIVNATPIGMKGFAADEQPLSDSVIKTLSKDTLVYDIVYNPLTTQFLKSAQKEGLQVVEGLDMLLYQAQKAIQIWTGKTPDFNEMKIAALRSL